MKATETVLIPKDQYTTNTLRCPGCGRWIGFAPAKVEADGTLEVVCPYRSRTGDDKCDFKGRVKLDRWVALVAEADEAVEGQTAD